LVRGDAGAGKTTALEYYTKNNTGVIFVTADSCTDSPTAVLNLIAEEIGLKAINSKSRIMKALISSLSGTNRLIIIDEADHLSMDALQAIRNLNDKAKVGIVLSGNNKLYIQMVAGSRGGEYDQIRTRIITRVKVSNNYSVEEIQAIFPDIDRDCAGLLLKLSSRESLRTAKEIYQIAVDRTIAAKRKLSEKLLQKTLNEMLGEAI
jgi:DNA transposition AAA+ family ATPase